MRRLAPVVLVMVAALGGCAEATPVETPSFSPTSEPTLEPQGPEPTGPMVGLGSGRILGTDWVYAIYPSAEGRCVQLEAGGHPSVRCGDLLPEGDDAFGSVGRGPAEFSGGQVAEGIVTDETATVWLVLENTLRIPAVLMSLDEAGLEGRAFVGIVPPDVPLTHVMAVKINGDVLQTYELP